MTPPVTVRKSELPECLKGFHTSLLEEILDIGGVSGIPDLQPNREVVRQWVASLGISPGSTIDFVGFGETLETSGMPASLGSGSNTRVPGGLTLPPTGTVDEDITRTNLGSYSVPQSVSIRNRARPETEPVHKEKARGMAIKNRIRDTRATKTMEHINLEETYAVFESLKTRTIAELKAVSEKIDKFQQKIRRDDGDYYRLHGFWRTWRTLEKPIADWSTWVAISRTEDEAILKGTGMGLVFSRSHWEKALIGRKHGNDINPSFSPSFSALKNKLVKKDSLGVPDELIIYLLIYKPKDSINFLQNTLVPHIENFTWEEFKLLFNIQARDSDESAVKKISNVRLNEKISSIIYQYGDGSFEGKTLYDLGNSLGTFWSHHDLKIPNPIDADIENSSLNI